MPLSLVKALRLLMSDCSNGYAKTYARAMLRDGNWMTEDERRTQIQYILSNTGGWRGETAREVKKVLRAY